MLRRLNQGTGLPPCELPDTAPIEFRLGECYSPGGVSDNPDLLERDSGTYWILIRTASCQRIFNNKELTQVRLCLFKQVLPKSKTADLISKLETLNFKYDSFLVTQEKTAKVDIHCPTSFRPLGTKDWPVSEFSPQSIKMQLV